MIAHRRDNAADATSVADVFLASFAATYPGFPALHTDVEVGAWIAEIVVAQNGVLSAMTMPLSRCCR